MFGFTRNESLLVCDTIGGRHLYRYAVGQRSLDYIASDIEAPMRNFELDRKWGVDASTILEKVRALNREQRQRLINAVCLYWEVVKIPQDEVSQNEALRKAGLL